MLRRYMDDMLPALERELQRQVKRVDQPATQAFHEMLAYHMGWVGRDAGVEIPAKRIRPLLVLLAAASLCDDWMPTLPAAAAVEIVHNFSLVHDDIEDASSTRRGRPALWTKSGTAMAINAGDALFALAHLAVLDLRRSFAADLVLQAAEILQEACLNLTRGQYLDMAYQRRAGLSVEDYWPMIESKTASLLAAGTQIGALLAGSDWATADRFRQFGRSLGLAFQVQDDILGIWGDEALTGKSNASDLLEGKSSLPVLYGMGRETRFAERWLAGPLRPEEVPGAARLLRDAGAYDYALRECQRLTEEALHALDAAEPKGDAGKALAKLTQQLLGRTN